MSIHYPVLPLSGGAAMRAFASLMVLVTYWVKQVARARRHRRDARILAKLDGRMLADIGITRSDVRDAFSGPFWEDPTAMLHERAIERRMNRALTQARRKPAVENGFHRPRIDRPARQVM